MENPEVDHPPPPVEPVPLPHKQLNGQLPAVPTPPHSPPTTPSKAPKVDHSLHSLPDAPSPPPKTPTVYETRRGSASSISVPQGHTFSAVLVSSALEIIASSKEAKRSPQLKESVQHALELVHSGRGGDRPREIFEPLKLACETRNEKLMIASLDCISKLISYSFFVESTTAPTQPYASPPPSPAPSSSAAPPVSLADLVTHTITSAYTESTPDSVSLQIVKALLALVLSSAILVHHSSLLKAVRTVYNVFLLSQDPVNQMVAQGGLTQMVNHVFARCQVSESEFHNPVEPASAHSSFDQKDGVNRSPLSNGTTLPQTPTRGQTPSIPPGISSVLNGDSALSPSPTIAPTEIVVTVNGSPETDTTRETDDSVRTEVDTEEVEDANTTRESIEGSERKASLTINTFETPNPHDELPDLDSAMPSKSVTTKDLFIKDAFLVFRALCKLTMKPLGSESERDLKSHAMRSKLLSLHLVLTILDTHMPIFVNPDVTIYSSSSRESTPFLQATKQYLCLSLSRNAVSSVPQVFETSVEIFWRVLSGMRTKLKKEIEVLLNEIFVPILEMKNSTIRQKSVLLSVLFRLSQDPQALVEIYLNYDCDRSSMENIYEKLMGIISKIGTTHLTAAQKGEAVTGSANSVKSPSYHGHSVPPSLTTAALSGHLASEPPSGGSSSSPEQTLKRQSLECLVSTLRSLVAWGTAPGKGVADPSLSDQVGTRSRTAEESQTESLADLPPESKSASSVPEIARISTPELVDDPTRFESAKLLKTTLIEGIKKFNFKPKRGIKFLVDAGFVPSQKPHDIAYFLLHTEGLSKAMIGEYLGEGDEENMAIMHAFVDQLDFTGLQFIDALRLFLQSFRLPGEAQKIDRFMLKFAERYIAGNPHNAFANADTAYVLAYSTIMLNTDAYNPQVKNRMTRADFIKNNRGINDGADLPEEFLSSIYDDIYGKEIRMKDEAEAIFIVQPGPGLANALANVGRDLQKEAYAMQSTGMANKTEALFRTMMRSQKAKSGDQFFSASHFVHVRPMFEVAWVPFLAGLSGPLQDTDDLEIVELCLDGFKSAIRIVCFFDLELERNAFVTTLAKFTFLNNLGEMKAKNMEAIKTLLDVAVTEGNNLRGSWREVLTCVSQLERMQLISNGIDVPEGRKGSKTGPHRLRRLPAEELANESRSTHITVAADMVFSLSHYLSGTAIVDFVQALSDVSWEEIQSSGLSEHPRLFSLQKLVDISYYNMGRIRLEWSNMWSILGEHFNQVCCHNNPHVAFFALDALRQLAMRFLEKEELAHFKFQKDFLKPFEFTMIHNPNPDVRDMVLQCLQQMIQLRIQNMRSGWRTMFGVFSAASKVLTERVASSAFDIVTKLNKEHFAAIVKYGSFADLTVCITDFCKVDKYQKISLLAIDMLRGVIPTMLSSPECALNTPPSPSLDSVPAALLTDDPMVKFWFPVLFSFYDIIMNGEDLEVRRLALDCLFNTLKTHGSTFRLDFWDTVCQEVLFPIFAVLRSSQDLSRFSTQEDMSVWLSTTMIQALRNLIDLYTFYFEILEHTLDGLLDLLCVCICQENDTLARIGTSCFQQLLENNVRKLSTARWDRVVTAFVRLFKTTTPHQLFDESLRSDFDGPPSENTDPADTQGENIIPAPLPPSGEKITQINHSNDRRLIFKQIIVKCVLQLLLIETTQDLLENDEVYRTIPPDQLLRLMAELDHSYQFARDFNGDKELRTGLWKVGFMKHLPNLLKQESSSAATLVNILLRMYADKRSDHQAAKEQVLARLVPLGLGVIEDFNSLKPDTQAKNIAAWTPVVADVLLGFSRFDDQAFARYLPAIYPLSTELLSREMGSDIREALRSILDRVGRSMGILERS